MQWSTAHYSLCIPGSSNLLTSASQVPGTNVLKILLDTGSHYVAHAGLFSSLPPFLFFFLRLNLGLSPKAVTQAGEQWHDLWPTAISALWVRVILLPQLLE